MGSFFLADSRHALSQPLQVTVCNLQIFLSMLSLKDLTLLCFIDLPPVVVPTSKCELGTAWRDSFRCRAEQQTPHLRYESVPQAICDHAGGCHLHQGIQGFTFTWWATLRMYAIRSWTCSSVRVSSQLCMPRNRLPCLMVFSNSASSLRRERYV